MPKLTEAQLQAMCVAYFRDQFPDYIIVASLNGIKLSGKQKYGVVEQQRKEGMLKGWPDLEVLLPHETIYIEMKIPGGKQSQEQKDIEAKLTELNKKYYLCFSFTEFKEIITNNLKC